MTPCRQFLPKTQRDPPRPLLALILVLAAAGCGQRSPEPSVSRKPHAPPRALVSSPTADGAEAPPCQSGPDASPADADSPQIDSDGDDDPIDTGSGAHPTVSHFERVGRSPWALQRVCDLTPFGDALYSVHSTQPLGNDGATVVRYQPDDPKHQFATAFDWNRPGEPTKGGGAGQGFLRVHLIGGRLFVPDADPPYNGLGLAEHGTEGYVFVSDRSGKFASARAPNHLPPGPPGSEGRPGAAVLPRAYHVIDAIRYRNRLYASTGSVPPKQQAWAGPSPGALHVANQDWSRWTYEVDYPFPWKNGVWRLTFLVRFKDRLYAGIQDYDGREPNDYVWFKPAPEATSITRDDLHAVRITESGCAQTIRWYADSGKLYWIASAGDGVLVRVTQDGDNWRVIDLPVDGGRPTDITRFRGALVVMAERGLYRLDGGAVTLLAPVRDRKSPFALTDIFCAAPLAVYRNELYVGGQRDGALYRLVEGS